jgi:ATP-binding cassette subfamily B protein
MQRSSAAALWDFSKRFAFPEWPWYLAGMVMLAATNYISLKIPQLAKHVVNEIDAADVGVLRQTVYAIIGLGFLLILIRTLSRILVFWPGRKLETSSKSYLFDRLMHLPQKFFDQHGMGDIISRIANDITHIRVFFGFGALQVMNLVFLVIFTISQMLTAHVGLTLATLAPLLCMVVILRITMPKMQKYSLENQQVQGELTNKATEAFVNIPVVKANGAIRAFTERIEHENTRVYASNIRLLVIRQVTFPLITLLSGLSQVVVLFYGGHEVLKGSITVGDIMAFNVYITFLAFPLSAIGIVISVYQRAVTAMIRIALIDEAPKETAGVRHTGPIESPVTLEVRNLSYQYDETSSWSLKDVSFQLRPGERLGLFGQIGSGKSTIMNLISRIYDPPAGTIFLNGVDITTIHPDIVRNAIGHAQQTAQLFSESIEDNLAFGTNASASQLQDAARSAEIMPEINAFKDKWHTQVGERGIRLSGGQKQRLSLARVFLRRPPVMMLDDVMSAVDQVTEQRLIENLYAQKSSLIISSHRISALRGCNRVLLLHSGKVIDQGSVDELIARHPEIDDSEKHS